MNPSVLLQSSFHIQCFFGLEHLRNLDEIVGVNQDNRDADLASFLHLTQFWDF